MKDPTVQTLEEIFSQISPEDEGILVSLPYRVGLYVSYADLSGGWDAQEKELQTLSGILRAYSEDFCKSEFVQKVLMESLAARVRWPIWAQEIERVPDEASQVIRLFTSTFLPAELEEFKQSLIDIALTVAMAFRETAVDTAQVADAPLRFTDMLRRIIGAEKVDNPLEHINISEQEKEALLRLCAALSYTRFERA